MTIVKYQIILPRNSLHKFLFQISARIKCASRVCCWFHFQARTRSIARTRI